MSFKAIQRILGILLTVFSVTMLPPVVVSWIYDDSAMLAFLTAFGIIITAGMLIWLPVAHVRREALSLIHI